MSEPSTAVVVQTDIGMTRGRGQSAIARPRTPSTAASSQLGTSQADGQRRAFWTLIDVRSEHTGREASHRRAATAIGMRTGTNPMKST